MNSFTRVNRFWTLPPTRRLARIPNGKPDLAKIDPLRFDFMQIGDWSIGERCGQPWREGKR